MAPNPQPGQIVAGAMFNEPMRIETALRSGDGTWKLGLVGLQTERFRSVTLSAEELTAITFQEVSSTYDGDGDLLRLGLQAYSLGIAFEFDPYFGLSVSRVDPLPNQLEAVYDHLLKLARVRFLLADDAGAGKTIMAGLLMRELKLRGLVDRVLIICPANLTFQWQRELKDKFDEKFMVLRGFEIRAQYGVNQWLEHTRLITSLDLAKRGDVLPSLRQAHWDLVIVDEAHRMSASAEDKKSLRYKLGELLRDTTDHYLLLTATPHRGDPVNFTLFLRLLDEDAFADVRSIRQAMENRRAPFYLRRVKEAMPATHIDRVLRDYYAGKLGDQDLESRLLRDVSEDRFRAICQTALEGLASKKLNLAMLVERRARAQERRVVPEAIARFLSQAAPLVPFALNPVGSYPHTFDPGPTRGGLRKFEQDTDWHLLPTLASRYPRFSTDRQISEERKLEWITPGHPLFEALRRNTLNEAQKAFADGACFYSLRHDRPARLDFYRARAVDGLGQVVHERLFAVEIPETGEPVLRQPTVLGELQPSPVPASLRAVASAPEPVGFLQERAFGPFLEEVKTERVAEVDRICEHVEISLTELIARADVEIGRYQDEKNKGLEGAAGRLAIALERHDELIRRRERRREELNRERTLTLQAIERIASAIVLPHPERDKPEIRGFLTPDPRTETTAMCVAMEYERAAGRAVADVHEKDLGYHLTSLGYAQWRPASDRGQRSGWGEGEIIVTPNEHRVSEDRRDCYWLYVVSVTFTAAASTSPAIGSLERSPSLLP